MCEVYRELLLVFMEHEGFAYMSHQEAACAALGHTVPSREWSPTYWGEGVTPCYCLLGPVVETPCGPSC
jgi:hypothetical protein